MGIAHRFHEKTKTFTHLMNLNLLIAVMNIHGVVFHIVDTDTKSVFPWLMLSSSSQVFRGGFSGCPGVTIAGVIAMIVEIVSDGEVV